jgi:hypothetical protein
MSAPRQRVACGASWMTCASLATIALVRRDLSQG